MATWQRMHPDWQYKVWTDHTGWENQAQIDAMPEWNGKADIMRWEILEREGGILVDADSECVQQLDESFLDNDCFACWENEEIRPGLVAAGYVGAVPGCALMRRCVDAVKHRQLEGLRAWQSVGPGLLTELAKDYPALRVYPARMFIPMHFSGVAAPGDAPVFARQYWGSTFGYDKIPAVAHPNVAVIIACYKQAQYLGGCIQSVLRQTLPVAEIIVASGCEECSQAARSIDDPRIVVIDGLTQGQADARNMAIAHAKSEYVLPLDADDQIDPMFIEKAASVLAPDRYAIVSTNLQEFGNRTGVWDLPLYSPATLLHFNSLCVTSLFSKALWEAAGGYDVALIGYEDWSFWISCARHNPAVRHIPERLLYYRIHGDNGMARMAAYDGLMRAMLRVRHRDLYTPGQIALDYGAIRQMPDSALELVEKRLRAFPDNEALQLFRSLALEGRQRRAQA